MVSTDRVEHGVFLAVLLGEVHADLGVPALHLVVHRLADIVQEPAAASEATVKTELVCNQLRDVRHFQRVLEDVLTEAGAKVEAASVEVNPKFALDAAQLKEKIEPGLTVRKPTYFD